MVNVQDLSLTELFQVHAFVNGDANVTFGTNQEGKLIVKAKLAEVEAELYNRIYGKNPFVSVTVEGQDPESIDLSQFDTKTEDEEEKPKTFVVAENKTTQE
jgi:hypothetical protein